MDKTQEMQNNSNMDMEVNFEDALENYLNEDFGDLEEGSITPGVVVRIGKEHVLVDVNFKSEGQIPVSEFLDALGEMEVKVGDQIDVYVVSKNESEGTIIMSRERAKRMQLFDKLEEIQEKDDVISGKIVRRIKGGYTVDLGGVGIGDPCQPLPRDGADGGMRADQRRLRHAKPRQNGQGLFGGGGKFGQSHGALYP